MSNLVFPSYDRIMVTTKYAHAIDIFIPRHCAIEVDTSSEEGPIITVRMKK